MDSSMHCGHRCTHRQHAGSSWSTSNSVNQSSECRNAATEGSQNDSVWCMSDDKGTVWRYRHVSDEPPPASQHCHSQEEAFPSCKAVDMSAQKFLQPYHWCSRTSHFAHFSRCNKIAAWRKTQRISFDVRRQGPLCQLPGEHSLALRCGK